MRNAYALLGVAFIIVFGGAFVILNTAQAPTNKTEEVPTNLIKKINTTMKLSSEAFQEGSLIPAKYTCSGENINPPLSFGGLPENTKSLVLVVDDSDIPQEIKEKMGIDKFDHWTVYNIPANTVLIEAGTLAGTTGLNTRGEAQYTGPCPPSEYEPTTHRYSFRLYALPELLMFEGTPTLDVVEAAAQEIMIEKAELVGLYSKVSG